MTRYFVSNSKGSFEKGDVAGTQNDTLSSQPDSVKRNMRPQATPRSATNSIPLMH